MNIKSYSKEEIQDSSTMFINFQDRFIIYGLYQGIKGEDYSDLLKIKSSDIAENYSYINLSNRKFICDDFMKHVLRGITKQDMYFINAYEDEMKENEDYYYFNNQSEYLIKSRPTSTNDGLGPMLKYELETKLKNFKKSFDELLDSKI